MADKFIALFQAISSRSKLIFAGIFTIVLIALVLFAPGAATINSSTPGISVFIDSSTNSVSQGSLQFLSRGEHNITVSKAGYYSVKQTINVSPILYKNIDIGGLVAASLTKDLSTGVIKINDLSTASFCDRFNNSVCIKASTLSDYMDGKKQLESIYAHDKSMPLIFYENSLSGEIIFYQSDKATIKILAQDDIDRPILIITAVGPNTSHADILQTISTIIGSQKYGHYLQYADLSNTANNQMPNGKIIYWNDGGE